MRYRSTTPSYELCERIRVNQSVLIVPGAHLGLEGFIRVWLGGKPEFLSEGLRRIGIELRKEMRTRDAELKRELGLRDVTLFAIACIVGTRWIAAAAHAGPGSVTLWLLAALLFVVPLAFAVASLAVRYPEAGGLYLWTRNDFGRWHGFLCFWVYWMGSRSGFPAPPCST